MANADATDEEVDGACKVHDVAVQEGLDNVGIGIPTQRHEAEAKPISSYWIHSHAY
jgi:hypothetical protein